MTTAPARTATVNRYGQVGLVSENSPSTQVISGAAGASSPAPAGFNAANLAGLVMTGVADAATTQQAVAAQASLLGKFETALSAVFDFVPPLVAVADPAAATLVEGIGSGVSAILAAVRNHAATTTAVPGNPPAAGDPAAGSPAAVVQPAPSAVTGVEHVQEDETHPVPGDPSPSVT